MKKRKIKPFIKWAGGKTQLLPILLENLKKDSKIYIEAFIGGGALFFSILDDIENSKIEKIIINDLNYKLMTLYITIRDNIKSLINELQELEIYYNNLSTLKEKENLYYQIREEFNQEKQETLKMSRNFLFLNKVGFNGLYRENSKGKFNVPFGKKETISLFDEKNLLLISEKLNLKKNNQRVIEIKNMDFDELKKYINDKTIVYLDPPYRPVTVGGFNAYNKSNFNDEEQIRLSKFCDFINQQGGKFLLSNSDPKVLDINDNFFDDLYNKYIIKRVKARRSINSDKEGRGKITEILVKNYESSLKKSEVIEEIDNNVELKLFSLKGEEKMKENFKIFLSQLKETNSTLDFFVDFEKVRKNVNKISLKLNQLNYLLGKEDLKTAIKEIYHENKSSFEVLNILIAVRDKKTKTIYNGEYYNLEDFFLSPEMIYKFIKLTNLEAVFKNKEIKNLVDYVYGVEVGLDTNARKNRSGKNMSNIIERIFSENKIPYKKEVKSSTYSELFSLGKDIKQFDFVIETQKTYLIEVNFYSSGGSKLNEVARAYTELSPKINQNENFEFIWITDGVGWLEAKNKLEEAYHNIPYIYNLKTLEEFIKKVKSTI